MSVEPPYQKRLLALQKNLRERDIAAALIMYSRDLYYFTGTAQPMNLWVPAVGNPILFSRRAHEMIKEATWIENLHPAKSFREMLKIVEEQELTPSTGSKIGVQFDILPTTIGMSLQRNLANYHLVDVSSLIKKQRLVKDETEIAAIRKSIELWQHGHNACLDAIEVGKTEYEISAVIEYALRRHGGDGLVWFRRWDAVLPGGCIVASGSNGWEVSGHAMTVTGIGMHETLPWGASTRKIQKGDLIVTDYGVSRAGYHADMARTYCVGKPNEQQRDLWAQLIELHLSVIEKIKPGVTGEELYLHAEKKAVELGYVEHFMGVGDSRGAYIGHSIGLEIDEDPVLGLGFHEPLPEGAIITIEPKFMVPGLGAVMVEDDVLITKTGYEILSPIEHELFYR